MRRESAPAAIVGEGESIRDLRTSLEAGRASNKDNATGNNQGALTNGNSQSSIQRSQFPPANIGRRRGLVNENPLDEVLY